MPPDGNQPGRLPSTPAANQPKSGKILPQSRPPVLGGEESRPPTEFRLSEKGMRFPTACAKLRIPPKTRGIDDDVRLEACLQASLSFADKQRGGAREAFGGYKSFSDRIRKAVPHPFSLATEIPLPKDAVKAAKFATQTEPRLLADFLGPQLAAPSELATSAYPMRKRWDVRFHHPSGKRLEGRKPTLKQMAEFCGFGASRWLGRFAA